MSSAAGPRAQLPERLVFRFQSMLARPKGREESYYGPIDKLLNTILSHESHMVKPQGPIKEEEAELGVNHSFDDSIASIVTNVSIDSEDSNISARSDDSYGRVPGSKAAKFPDFIVCQYSASATADKPNLIIEVKKDAKQLEYGLESLRDYIDMMGGGLGTSFRVHGVVIAGPRVAILTPHHEHPFRYKRDPTFSRNLSVMDDEFLGYLYERASLSL